jgi:hypothetical protein
MTAKGQSKLLFAAILGACLLAVLLASCSEKAGGTRRPNVPPETFIAFGPREDSLTYYKVQVFWFGEDEDGTIDHFLINTVEDVDRTAYGPGFDWDSLDGWAATTSKESTFVLMADSCCLSGVSVKTASAMWGVLVRAVDNSGAVSEEPAMLFFRATNVLPSVSITVPVAPGTSVRPPLTGHPYFEWEGDDPDGDAGALQYKYIAVVDADVNPQTVQTLPPLTYEDTGSGHAAPVVGKWSRWVAADCTYVKDMDLELYKPQQGQAADYIWFCVAAKDEGGAILPSTRYARLCGVMVDVGSGVRIFIDGGAMGIRDSKDYSRLSAVSGIFTGTTVSFRFWGEESRSAGNIAEAFRYYWDSPSDPTSSWSFWTGVDPLRERGRTPEWLIRYPRDGSVFEPALGSHILYVEVRDVNRTTTWCQFRLEVLPGPSRVEERKILFVDDNEAWWLPNRWKDYETSDDAFWADVLEGYPVEIVDTGRNHRQKEVDIRLVNSATTVIWDVDDVYGASLTQLFDLCTQKGNYLYSYVKVGGNLILIGKDPVYSTMYWPDGSIWSGTNNEAGSDLRFQLAYGNYESLDSWDFTPLAPNMTTTGDSVFNWNWDIFGIKRIAFSKTPIKPVNGLISCPSCDPAFRDTIPTIAPPGGSGFEGEFGNAAYITDLRTDIDVRPLFAGGLYNAGTGTWTNYGDKWLLGIYTPGRDGRGSVAYIGVPVYWFNHEDIKALIRHLLTEFGEQPQGS